jgi:ribosome-associated protein
MPEDVSGDLVVSPTLTIPADELSWRFSHASGPGGQSVNTTDSRVELRWDLTRSAVVDDRQRARLRQVWPTGVARVVAAEHRSQWQNRRAARHRLAAAVLAGLAPPRPTRRPTRPHRGAVERRLADKRRRAEQKRLRRAEPDA